MNILWAIILILLLLWVGGFVIGSVGSIIHILLVIALVLLIFNLITGRRAV